MKRILLMMMCFVVLSVSVCSAEIRKSEVDSFDGTLILYSTQQNIGDFKLFNFYKNISKGKNVNIIFMFRHIC